MPKPLIFQIFKIQDFKVFKGGGNVAGKLYVKKFNRGKTFKKEVTITRIRTVSTLLKFLLYLIRTVSIYL